MPEHQVRFNGEGGIVAGDPCLPAKFFTLTQISSWASTWGTNLFPSLNEAVIHYGQLDGFSRIDRGSLFRIAEATENLVQEQQAARLDQRNTTHAIEIVAMEQRATNRAIERMNKTMKRLVDIFEKLKQWTDERSPQGEDHGIQETH